MAQTPTGREISIRDLKVGDQVLALDYNDQVVPSEVISFIHYEHEAHGKLNNKSKIKVKSSFHFFSILLHI